MFLLWKIEWSVWAVKEQTRDQSNLKSWKNSHRIGSKKTRKSPWKKNFKEISLNFVTWRKYFHRWERCFLFRLAEGLWLFNIATNALLRGINWLNKSAINVSSCYRLVSFDTDDLKLVTSIYEVMYPKRQIEASHLAETRYKFGSFKTGQTRVGPKRSHEEYVLLRY